MGAVVLDITMTLDGFIAGPNDEIGPIHDWVIAAQTDRDREILEEAAASGGAVIMGRRTFNLIDNPDGWKLPDGTQLDVDVVVLTHEKREPVTKGKTRFSFVDDVRGALALAQEVAGDKKVSLMGASTAQQFVAAGLVDEMLIHVAPVLFGAGIRLFDNLGPNHVKLEIDAVEVTPGAAHLRFKVIG